MSGQNAEVASFTISRADPTTFFSPMPTKKDASSMSFEEIRPSAKIGSLRQIGSQNPSPEPPKNQRDLSMKICMKFSGKP